MSELVLATGGTSAPVLDQPDPSVRGSYGPWRAAAGQLVRNRGAMAALVVLVLVVLASLAAPLYAGSVAHTEPFTSNISGTTLEGGKQVPLLEPSSTGLGLGVTPIGPTWELDRYFLGVDNQGRDVMARLLYGGRTSLLISVVRRAAVLRGGHRARHARGLLRRRRRRRAVAAVRRRVGLPGLPAGDLPVGRAAHQRPDARPGAHRGRAACGCRSSSSP